MSDEPVEEPVDLYNEAYWQALDGGRGAQPSLLWSDIAFILHHVVGHNHETGEDLAGTFRAVDVGCGPGFLVQALQARGIDTVGLDVSPYALSIAPEEIRNKLQLFDLGFVNDSFFGCGIFGLVVSTEALEHVVPEQADRAVKHLSNLLTPGGIAILTICVEGRENDNDPTHVNVVPRSYWERKFELVGLRKEPEMEVELKRFHLFESHNGVFALRKPGR